MSEAPLAYKYVFIAAIVSQLNYYAPRMNLPIPVPVREQDICYLHISSPLIIRDFQNWSGCIQVKNYSFTFFNEAHGICRMDEHRRASYGVPRGPDESIFDVLDRASQMNYLVSTNDVYRIATNLLVALDVDLERLEARYRPCLGEVIYQSKRRGPVPSPVVYVGWDNPTGPGSSDVRVAISAVTGELLSLDDGNGSYRKRREPLIKNLKELLAISDGEFLKYSDQL